MSNLISAIFAGGDVYSISAAVAAVFIAAIVIISIRLQNDESPVEGIRRIGEDDSIKTSFQAKQRWLKSATKLIYGTLEKNPKPFQVQAHTGPLVVLPATFFDEVRNDERMTFAAWLNKDFYPQYPGFEGFVPSSDPHNDVFVRSVRIGLTQTLGHITEVLSEETEDSLKELFPLKNEWQEAYFSQDALKIIARLSSVAFVPKSISHNEEWLKIIVDYTTDFFAATMALRMWPPITRPFVHWFLPQGKKVRKEVAAVRRIFEPELAARRAAKEEALRTGIPAEKPLDAFQWLESAEEATGNKCDPVAGLLNYSLGSIHTTSLTLINALYDLVNNPQYIPLLQEELNQVLAEGGGWGKGTLNKLKLMDSFMKESQRVSPVTIVPINRIVETPITLSDGTKLPKGAYIGVPTTRLTDPTVYEDPLTFNGHRFYDRRQVPGDETKWQFVTTSADHISFGHGKHACPGRFFASNEIKLVLAHMITNYEWKFEDGKRPITLEVGVSRVPNPKAKILYRARAKN